MFTVYVEGNESLVFEVSRFKQVLGAVRLCFYLMREQDGDVVILYKDLYLGAFCGESTEMQRLDFEFTLGNLYMLLDEGY